MQKNSFYSHWVRPFLAALVTVLTFFSLTVTAMAEDRATDTDGDQTESRIHITADRLVSEATGERTTEFIGNVRATQGDTVITADRLKVYHKQGSTTAEDAAGKDAIKKIVANGNVTIRMEDKVAVTEQAAYMIDTDVLILTGPNSKVTSEKNSVSGDKITLHRKDNSMVVDGSSEERVEMILYTKDKGIQ